MQRSKQQQQTTTLFLIGAPSAGKTVLAARLYAYLLMRGKRVIHIPETVSLLIRRGKVKGPEDIPQKEILASLDIQKKEYQETGLTDYIISEDNPLATRLYSPGLFPEQQWPLTFAEYEPCCYVKINLDIYPEMYDASTRIHSFSESLALDKEIDTLVEKYQLRHLKVSRTTPLEDIISWAEL